MRDDLEFYITLLREVEANPLLYDHNHVNYSNRTAGEDTWFKIGRKLDETGIACKSKWRNLRSTYIRYLHSRTGQRSGACPQKEYYLAPYFNFLKPFIKSRKPDSTLTESPYETTDNDSVEQICVPLLKIEDGSLEEFQYETEESRSNDVYSPPISENPPPAIDSQTPTSINNEPDPHIHSPPQVSGIKRGCGDCETCTIGVSSIKRKKLECDTRDACELFLLSLLPRMQSMNEPQQLSFQIGVMQLMQNIKYSSIKSDC